MRWRRNPYPRLRSIARNILRGVSSRILVFWYIGNKLTCPVCGWHFRKMKPSKGSYYIKGQLVDSYTENSICPRCNSGMRHRFVFTFLVNNINILQSRIKLLHFSAEPPISRLLKRQSNIEYITCDVNPARDAIKVDMTDIQFPDATFDAIISIHVLEHIRDDVKAINELYRILKPGGWALIAVPTYGDTTFEIPGLDYEGRMKMYGIGDHMRLNGLDLKTKLSDAGFSVDVFSFDDVPGRYIDRNVTSPHVESDKYLFFCTK